MLKVILLRAQKDEKSVVNTPIDSHEHNGSWNVDTKSHSIEALDGNEERVMSSWRDGDLYYKVSKSLAELVSSVIWKVELVSN